MTEKAKKFLVITLGSALCLALAVGICLRFSGTASATSGSISDPVWDTKDHVVSIQNAEPQEGAAYVADITISDKNADPAAGAVSTGTEQTIQAYPVRPEAPEKPTAPSTVSLPDDHQAEDVPLTERNAETPPSYMPEQTTVKPAPRPDTQGGYDRGESYVPGFGYIQSSGDGTVIQDNTIYENGNKVGNMD